MKYEAITKRKRNLAIVKYRFDNPELALSEIGEVYRITRQRVHQILKKYKAV